MSLPRIELPIVTSQLRLRALRIADAEARYQLHSDDAYVRHIGAPIDRDTSDAQLAHELSEGYSEYFIMAICQKDSEMLIGECVLAPSTTKEVELALALLPDHRRSGYGVEAATAAIAAALACPDIDTVIACVDDDNEAGKYLVEKLGMRQEGRMIRPSGRTAPRYVITRQSP
jgi:ribosomal-protein-alanine N-acetyltransferase